jgi:uncharacterized protein with von Willebrand factor type A (vWA) domain
MKTKKQLSHELSKFGEFIASQKSRRGSELFASKKRYQSSCLDQDELRQFKSGFDTFHDEMFGRFYENSQELDNPIQWSKDIHDMLDELPEFQSLQRTVKNDPELSALSSAFVAKQFEDDIIDVLKAKAKQAEQNKEDNQQDGGNREEDPANIPFGDLPADVQSSLNSSMTGKEQALQDQNQKTKDVKQGLKEVGMGYSPNGVADPAREAFVELMFNDISMRNLMKLIGRLKREMRSVPSLVPSKRKIKSYDLEQGRLPDEIQRERFLACNDDTFDMYCFRASTRKQFVRKKANGEEKSGSGPIIMCMDVSGSMSGEPLQLAKSMAIALLSIAGSQKREFHLVTFSSRLIDEYSLPKKHKKDQYSNLVQNLYSIGSGGGTDFDYPIRWAIKKAEHVTKGDIIFLTDGRAPLHYSDREKINQCRKKLGTRFFTVYVNSYEQPDLEDISDGSISVSNLRNEKSISEIGKLLKSVKNNKS